MKINKKLKLLIVFLIAVFILIGAGSVFKIILLRQIEGRIQSNFDYTDLHLSLFRPVLIIDDLRSKKDSPSFSAKKIHISISYKSLLSKHKPFNVFVERPNLRINGTFTESKKRERNKIHFAFPFTIEKGVIKEGNLYYIGKDIVIHSECVNALFNLKKDRFFLKAESKENIFSFKTDKNPVESKISLVLEGNEEEIIIERLRINGPDHYVKAHGTLVNPFDPEIKIETLFQVKASLIADLFVLPFDWKGKAKGKGIFTRINNKTAFNAGFSSKDFVFNRVPMGIINGKVDYKENTGGILDCRIRKRGFPPEYLNLHFKEGEIKGTVQRLYLDPIMNYFAIPYPVSSPVWGNFTMDKGFLSAEAEFRAEAVGAKPGKFPFQGKAKFNLDGKNEFSFSAPSLDTGFATLNVKGNVIHDQNVDVFIQGDIGDVKEAREFTSIILDKEFPFPEIRGMGRGNIHIFDDFHYPRIQAELSFSAGGFDNFNAKFIEATAELVKNNFLATFNVDDTFMKGAINLVTNKEETKVDFQINQGTVENILPSLYISVPLEGEASGNFEFTQSKEDIKLKGFFSSPLLRFAGQPLSQVNGKLEWEKGLLAFTETHFVFHGGNFNGSILLQPLSQKFDVDIRGDEINLSSIAPALEGNLSINLKGKGDFEKDLASGNFAIKNLYFPPFQKTESNGKVKLSFSEDKAHFGIDGNFLPGENEFKVSLEIPFEEDSLKGEIRGFFSNADLLLPWKGAKGQINYLAEIKGPKSSPKIKGAIDFKGSVFPLPHFAHALRDFSGLVFVENGEFSLRSFQGKFGGGDVHGSGFLKLGKKDVEAIDVKVEGRNLLVSPLERTRAIADGSLNLIKDANHFDLIGDFLIHRLSYRREITEKFAFSSTPYYLSGRKAGFFDDLNLNIHLKADDNAWMENSLGKVRAKFDLTVAGNIYSPILLGDIEALSGEVYFQDREFNVLNGKVSFLNPAAIEPYLNFKGETHVKDYHVTVSLDGLVDSLNPEFSSSPPLPPEDVLALLAVGESFRRTYHYDRSTQQGTTSLLSFQLSEEAKKRSKGLFSVDRFRIDPFVMGSSAEMKARLTVGKKIARNFFILYSTNLSTQREEITRLEWELTEDISIVGIKNELGRVSFDVKIHKRF